MMVVMEGVVDPVVIMQILYQYFDLKKYMPYNNHSKHIKEKNLLKIYKL
jgi:hypothetical protein